MEDDILPILGHFGGNDEESSDSDEELDDNGQDNIIVLAEAEDDEDYQEREDEDSNEEEDDNTVPNVTFDKSLPSAHSYLGTDLEEVRGRTIHDDDSYISVPLLSLPGVVLCPGQTLPLQLFQNHIVSMMQRVVDNDKTFGLVTSRYDDNYDATLATIGTTAEVLAFKMEEDDISGIRTCRVKAIGRQRFQILDTRRQVDGTVMARVNILPEYTLPDPLDGVRPLSHFRPCIKAVQNDGGDAGDMTAIMQQWLQANKKPRVNRLSCAHLTQCPPWVYKQYDVQNVMKQVKDELKSWNESLKEGMMPPDPSDFSFWVAANLPLDDTLKLRLLWINSAIQRLRCELSIMQRCTALCCRECSQLIANKKDVFSMSLEGPMGAYVNPGGYVHETLTVYKAQGLNLIGRASTQNSWFPGYAWTILQCRTCDRHMGWKFTATKKSLQPQKFWGLTRSGLMPGLKQKPASQEEEEESHWRPIM